MHGNLANRVISQGRHVHVEDLSKKSWQQNWGRSVGFRAPAMFESLLFRKAGSAGGTTTLVNPYRAKLSQLCVCGQTTKKPLSQRSHICPCGRREQRDIWSAFLARHTSAGGVVDFAEAQTELRQRDDVGAGRGSIKPNLEVPKAKLRAPEYASGRPGRLAQSKPTGLISTATVEEAQGGSKNHGRSRP